MFAVVRLKLHAVKTAASIPKASAGPNLCLRISISPLYSAAKNDIDGSHPPYSKRVCRGEAQHSYQPLTSQRGQGALMFLVRFSQFEEEKLLDRLAGFPSIPRALAQDFVGLAATREMLPAAPDGKRGANSPVCYAAMQNIFRRVACW